MMLRQKVASILLILATLNALETDFALAPFELYDDIDDQMFAEGESKKVQRSAIIKVLEKIGLKGNCRKSNGFTLRCPTSGTDLMGLQCVTMDDLCNGIPDCPGLEDENASLCMFWLASQELFRQLRKIILDQYAQGTFAQDRGHPAHHKSTSKGEKIL